MRAWRHRAGAAIFCPVMLVRAAVEDGDAVRESYEVSRAGAVESNGAADRRSARGVKELDRHVRALWVLGVGGHPSAKRVGPATGVDVGLAQGGKQIHLLGERTGKVAATDAMSPRIVRAGVFCFWYRRTREISRTVVVGAEIPDPAGAGPGF